MPHLKLKIPYAKHCLSWYTVNYQHSTPILHCSFKIVAPLTAAWMNILGAIWSVCQLLSAADAFMRRRRACSSNCSILGSVLSSFMASRSLLKVQMSKCSHISHSWRLTCHRVHPAKQIAHFSFFFLQNVF